MVGVSKNIKKRLLVILAAFSILFLVLIVRVFWIQVINGKQYQSMAYAQTYKSQIIIPKRGMIFDRNNKELAVNIQVDTISADPLLVKGSRMDVNQIAKEIADTLNIDKNELLKKLQKNSRYEVIKRKTEKDVSAKLKKWINANKINGIYFSEGEKRFYPNKNLAAQVIGFTGMDNQGLSGIELSMEKYLLGQPGLVSAYEDANGQKIPLGEEKHIAVQDGLNIVLTIDEAIQSFAEKTLQKAIDDYKVLQGGTVIVMDPRDGDILAMVSKPDFDLNDPFTANSFKYKNNVQEFQKVWTNKAISNTYEPGSTFKSITAAAALEEGIITPESEVVDIPIKVAGWTISSMTPGGHGKETFRESVITQTIRYLLNLQ